ncbi:MAG: 3'-5' exonuclease [Lentimicrobiaceae bacterium]|nr:3'-5' exonuclease [Lentimicrobiaceae bacterium]
MLTHINLNKVLFLDIETVPQYRDYEAVPEKFKALWDHKAKRLSSAENDTPESLYERAGIYAEFGKIICISVGYVINGQLRIKSFAGDDESELLNNFAQLLNQRFNTPDVLLCAHNGKEFDFPYLCRRMLINRIPLPLLLDTSGRKPWEVQHIDTMEMWKFGDYKSYTSLNLLTAVFDIPTPKDDIDGSEVGKTYWQDADLPRITAYCQKDVVAIVQLLLRYKGMPLIDEKNIFIV